MKLMRFLLLLLSITMLSACNKDGTITQEIGQKPTIELDSQTGIYTVKAGHALTIAPTVHHAAQASYAWLLNGETVSHDASYTATWPVAGEYYLTFSVQTAQGKAEEELKVEVAQLTPPVISLIVPPNGLKAVAATDYILTPTIHHADLAEFKIEWLRDGLVVSRQRSYTFNQSQIGTYTLTINASNIDGQSSREVSIEVVERMPATVSFPTPSTTQIATDRYTVVHRTLCLKPLLAYFDQPQFEWQVNGEVVDGATAQLFCFTPDAAGDYRISVVVREGATPPQPLTREITRAELTVKADVTVHCVRASEAEMLRPRGAGSSSSQHKVYEWTPAPGQFIGEVAGLGGVAGNDALREAAHAWALQRLNARRFVSLGDFGGYLVVGFDHSIARTDAPYDFTIEGNAFGNSSEPGIVYVMQDTNQNGLPDDEWYELKGCESGKAETRQEYAITYFRPAGRGLPVAWIDSEGKTGEVAYLPELHPQDSYYPAWIGADSYTLRGTCLSSKNRQNPVTGFWEDEPFDWGYADNFGQDRVTGGNSTDGSGQRNGFRIANAIQLDGSAIALQYIDFVKVQTGVQATRGSLGEVSTEVFGFNDYAMRAN
ncbi:MAG: PKD-like domain-containing protein [Alistipes sp.]